MTYRVHHYLFAHKLLPSMFYRNPLKFIADCNEGREKFLNHIWQRVGEDFIENDAERLPPTGLRVIPIEDSPISGSLIVMPQPKNLVEAHMTCALGTLKKGIFSKKKLKHPGYFTLELGEGKDDVSRTMMCKWTDKGAHLNFGYGPPADERDFIKACIDQLSTDYSPNAIIDFSHC